MKYEKKVVFCQFEPFGEVKTMYFVRQKKHWWSRWKYIKENDYNDVSSNCGCKVSQFNDNDKINKSVFKRHFKLLLSPDVY